MRNACSINRECEINTQFQQMSCGKKSVRIKHKKPAIAHFQWDRPLQRLPQILCDNSSQVPLCTLQIFESNPKSRSYHELLGNGFHTKKDVVRNNSLAQVILKRVKSLADYNTSPWSFGFVVKWNQLNITITISRIWIQINSQSICNQHSSKEKNKQKKKIKIKCKMRERINKPNPMSKRCDMYININVVKM